MKPDRIKHFDKDQHTWVWAAGQGFLDVIIWFHENNIEGCDYGAMDLAAANGHLDIIEFLYKNRSKRCSTNAIDWSCMTNRIDSVKFLYKIGKKGTPYAMIEACQANSLDIIKFLYENGEKINATQMMSSAIGRNSVEIATWLNELNIELNYQSYAICFARLHGYNEILEFLEKINILNRLIAPTAVSGL